MFEIWGFPIRSYGLVVAIAILIGIGVTLYFAKQAGKNEDQVFNLAFMSVLGGFIGARLWEVLFFEGAYYMQHPSEILAVWNGGLSIQGGLVGGVLAAVWYLRKLGWKFWETADLFAPGMIIGQAVGRIACLLNGDAYGSSTGGSFGLVYPPGTAAYDRYGSQPLWSAAQWTSVAVIVVALLLAVILPRMRGTGSQSTETAA